MDSTPDRPSYTADDLRACGWKAVVEREDRPVYFSIHHALWKASNAAGMEDNEQRQAALRGLGDALSMTLKSDRDNNPYAPIIQDFVNGRRTALPEDFSEAEIAAFAEFVPEVDDPWIKARLADIVWLRTHDHTFAYLTIDTLLLLPLQHDDWRESVKDGFRRAVGLCRMLGRSARSRLRRLEAKVLEAFEEASGTNVQLAHSLATFLADTRLARSKADMIASYLEAAARANVENHGIAAESMFQTAARWYHIAKDNAKAAAMQLEQAELVVRLAEARLAPPNPSNLAANMLLEQAIQILRAVDPREGAGLGLKQRIEELRQRKLEVGEASLAEMGTFRSPPIDLSPFVRQAQKRMRKQPMDQALLRLATAHTLADPAKLREEAIESIRNHPLLALLNGSHIGSDGRTIAKSPTMAGDSIDANGTLIHARMVEDHVRAIPLFTIGAIQPALDVFRLEHHLTESNFIYLARSSPVVPVGHEVIVGKGLFCGYELDFGSAIHLLIPQLEHSLRVLFQSNGVLTSMTEDGEDRERGIKWFLSHELAPRILGSDLQFEMSSLLVDKHGPNLRHNLAHGLLFDGACYSAYAIYSWYLFFRIVILSWFNATHPTASEI